MIGGEEMNRDKISVKIEWEGNSIELQGDPETVVREVESFLLKSIPQISLAKKLQVSIDAQDLSEIISPLVRVTPRGEIIMLIALDKVSLSDRILITLIAQKFLFLTGASEGDHLSLRDVSSRVFASLKSASSRLSELNSQGLIEKERVKGQTRYCVTIHGILDFKRKKLPKLLKKVTYT